MRYCVNIMLRSRREIMSISKKFLLVRCLLSRRSQLLRWRIRPNVVKNGKRNWKMDGRMGCEQENVKVLFMGGR